MRGWDNYSSLIIHSNISENRSYAIEPILLHLTVVFRVMSTASHSGIRLALGDPGLTRSWALLTVDMEFITDSAKI